MNFVEKISHRLNISPELIGLDGIKFRGKGPEISETGFWSRSSGTEESVWTNSRIRLLEITKDLNDEEVWDIRAETGLKNHNTTQQIGCRWYEQLMQWEFLILKFLNERIFPEYNTLNSQLLIGAFNSSVTARINCKKTAGKGKCPDKILNEHIALYGDIITDQINGLKPNVIYIGGCSKNIILNKIVKRAYPDLVQAESSGWIYYSYASKVIVINGYNPGIFNKKSEVIFNELKHALSLFKSEAAYKDFSTHNSSIKL